MDIKYFKSALSHHGKGNWNKAKEIYEHILKSNPNNYAVLQNYGPLLCQLKEYKIAKNVFEKCLKLNPKDSLLLYNYGKFFHDQKIFEKAITYYKKSFELNPKNVMPLYNAGNIYLFQNEIKKAINLFKEILEINPSHFLACNNLGIAYKRLGKFDEAINYYRKAIEIKKDYVDAHINLSTILLTKCNFDEGLNEYEWRKKSKSFSDYIDYEALNLKSKIWDGEDLRHKTILIIVEQGIGDLIQFSRYLFLLKEEYEVKIIIKSKNKNFSHFFSSHNFDFISESKEIPKHDYHIFLMSLMRIFFKKNKLFYKSINFFQSDIEIKKKWQKIISNLGGTKIGIHWSTSFLVPEKDLQFDLFNNLSKQTDKNFIVLQKEIDKLDLLKINKNKKIHHFSEMDKSEKPFIDSIEIIRNLDLVITSDTSIAHLSATLGINTWIALPLISDWRWFNDTKKSKWYSNVKLYRQKNIGDWDSAFKLIAKDLLKL